jgi:F-type H+-transporting ATPase subunit gamma
MASIKDLKKRIGTVKNTQQTTKAMKMVSTAKLRRAQEAVRAHRPYAKEIQSLIEIAAGTSAGAQLKSRLIRREGDEPQENKGTALLVVVTSDRGLCGGFNGNAIRAAQRWLESNRSRFDRVDVGCVGKRGYDFFRGRGRTIGYHFPEFGGKVTFAVAKRLAQDLIAAFESGKYNEIYFLYNEFKNASVQAPVAERFLPVEATQAAGKAAPVEMIKPSPVDVLELLLKKSFTAQAYRVLLESQAGEHGARMTAMSNATDNAGEMIRLLTLEYNKQRQAGITKELLEIIAGSESQKTA